MSEVRPIDEVSKPNTKPLFIVHSELDSIVPVDHAYDIYKNAKNPTKKLWIIKDTEHVGGYFVNSNLYVNKVVSFLEQAFELLNTGDPETSESLNAPTSNSEIKNLPNTAFLPGSSNTREI